MSYVAAKPRYTLPFAGKEYELVGSFDLIESIEHALKEDSIRLTMKAMDLSATDTAKLLAVVLTSCGHKMTIQEVADLLWSQVGLSGGEFIMLRLHLYAFLRICISPPAEREATTKQMGELIGEWNSASPGKSTKNSA